MKCSHMCEGLALLAILFIVIPWFLLAFTCARTSARGAITLFLQQVLLHDGGGGRGSENTCRNRHAPRRGIPRPLTSHHFPLSLFVPPSPSLP